MAIRNMRVNPNTAISQSLGFNPRGVIVSNVTPYWLYFPQAEQYCPPFTSGWSAPFIQQMAGYGYMEIKTPYGQTVQTNVPAGVAQFVELTFSDSEIGFSPGENAGATGSSIDPANTTSSVSEILTVSAISTIWRAAGSPYGGMIACPPDKRVRLLTSTVAYSLDGGHAYVPVSYYITPQSGVIGRLFSALSPTHPVDHLIFPEGLDFAVGINVGFISLETWADVRYNAAMTYQLIG